MDVLEAFTVFKYSPDRFRTCWVFQARRHAEAHLKRANLLQSKRQRQPADVNHSIRGVQLFVHSGGSEFQIHTTEFIPVVGIVESGIMNNDWQNWHHIRLLRDEQSASRIMATNYGGNGFRIFQAALVPN